MVECAVCGWGEFIPHDGYYYCAQCQTQSQDLLQQEATFIGDVSKKGVSTKSRKKKKGHNTLGSGVEWTSWQAMNFILKGMTEELVALGAPEQLQQTVLSVWASFLKVNQVAFVSKSRQTLPKLDFPYRYRDGKVLYDIDTHSRASRKSKEKKIKMKWKKKNSSSARSARATKKKMLVSDYESQLSATAFSDEANMTLASLNLNAQAQTGSKLKIPLRKHLTEKGYRKREASEGSESRLNTSQHVLTKYQMITILYLALAIDRSQIQLSDLFRFIREGYLSYSVVSHFLPEDIKFGRMDSKMINTHGDYALPTHIEMRKHGGRFTRLLNIRSLPVPDLEQLLRRYATDLLLPNGMAELGIDVLRLVAPPRTVQRRKSTNHIPSFELMALAPLLVVFKLVLGMDGVTEYETSHLAATVNRLNGGCDIGLFSFRQWQRAIECRRTVLSEWHYPTRECSDSNSNADLSTGVKFLQSLYKDVHLRSRRYEFSRVSGVNQKLEECVEQTMKELLSASVQPSSPAPLFTPSLTPGCTLLHELITFLRVTGQPDPPWMNILVKDWPRVDVSYLVNPDAFRSLLEQNGVTIRKSSSDWLTNHMSRVNWIQDKLQKLTEAENDLKLEAKTTKKKPFKCRTLLRKQVRRNMQHIETIVSSRNDHMYWRLNLAHWHETPTSLPLRQFNDEIMDFFAPSWSWLLTQCSQMLHITTRDIYLSVVQLEDALIQACL